MTQRSISPLMVVVVAVIVVAAAVTVGWTILKGDPSLLRNVSMGHERLSPNADGTDDITPIQYEVARNATVSIYFEDAAGQRTYFRRDEPRGAGEYQVYFSGVVDGYRRPDEAIQGQIVSRLLADGPYTWTIEATDTSGVTEQHGGTVLIADADATLPEIRNFSLDRHVFTPNRDGIGDRVQADLFLAKEANLRVFLLTPDGTEVPIAEKDREVPPGLPGRHLFDYEGGVDNGATPPPDGTYTIVALAEDAEGQKIRVEEQLTIQFGGVPRAEILSPVIGDTFELSSTAVSLCDTVFFTVTVQNYGDAPIRTTGPAPDVVYDSHWNYNTVGWSTESGAWRIGVGYENALSDYPYRWALGRPEELTEIDGHYYLMPGERAVVTGGMRITGVLGARNPQPIWVGLIHEDVEIAQFNSRVDPHELLIELPDAANVPSCEE